MHFLQSPAWAAFQAAVGRTTHRIHDVLLVEHATPLGAYWYAARPELASDTLDALVIAAKEQHLMFLRIDPLEKLLTPSFLLLASTSPTQPQTTLVRRIDLSDDQLLASFKEKTRYNIRLAGKKGVTVRASTAAADVAVFARLAEGTGARQDFRYHTAHYYETMLEQANEPGGLPVQVLLAEYDGEPVAVLILLTWEDTAYYLHGASNHAARAVMAPHLLQFEAMRIARDAGAKLYDFWGIAPPKTKPFENHESRIMNYEYDQSHPWAGVTRFKLGFGGEVVHAPDSFDIVLNPLKYRLYTTLRTVRRWFT